MSLSYPPRSVLSVAFAIFAASNIGFAQETETEAIQEVEAVAEVTAERGVAEAEASLEQELGAEPQPASNDKATDEDVSASAKADVESKTKFLRVTREDEELQAMDTAVVTYESKTGGEVSVDLIGAVHIGEARYYAELNELFDTYDVLLYELVAPEGTVLPRGGARPEGFNPVAMLQDGAKKMLGLESQLEKIDYTKKHFVRADMTPSQIAEKMAERGDTAFTLILDTVADAMRQQNLAKQDGSRFNALAELEKGLSLTDMFGNPLKMKQLMALQFEATGSLDGALGESLNQLLIVDRNQAALKGLQQQLAAGKKKIGIFYGAAHLEEMEKHLLQDFGMKQVKQRWIQAWDLTQAKERKLSEPATLLLNLLDVLD